MSPQEKEILVQALNTLDGVALDHYNYDKNKFGRYNYEVYGKMLMAKRALAEIIGLDINLYLLPGETPMEADDDKNDWQRFYGISKDKELNLKTKKFIISDILPMLDGLIGLQDSDEACLRCAKRMIAEVAGYPDLKRYFLLFEKEVVPKYYKQYISIEAQ